MDSLSMATSVTTPPSKIWRDRLNPDGYCQTDCLSMSADRPELELKAMRRMSKATLALLALMMLILLTGCTADSSGCSGFAPASTPVEVGDTTNVSVEIVNNRWSTPDIAGAFWSTDEPVPEAVAGRAFVDGTAQLVEASMTDNGGILSGTVVIEFTEIGSVEFTGPIGCE